MVETDHPPLLCSIPCIDFFHLYPFFIAIANAIVKILLGHDLVDLVIFNPTICNLIRQESDLLLKGSRYRLLLSQGKFYRTEGTGKILKTTILADCTCMIHIQSGEMQAMEV
jgi:hypothetical protein